MGQTQKVGTQVGPSRIPIPGAPGAPAPPPPPPMPGGLGALSRQKEQDKQAALLQLLMSRQYPQFMGQAPTIPTMDMSQEQNAQQPSAQDDIVQSLLQRAR